MNSAATDLAKRLETEGIGSLGLGTIGPGAGVGIFVGDEPPEPSESVTLYVYLGEPDDTLQGAPLDRCHVQVRCRSRGYEQCWALAQAVEKVLDRLGFSVPEAAGTGQSCEYLRILRIAPISELGKDEKGRQLMVQDYLVMRQLIP